MKTVLTFLFLFSFSFIQSKEKVAPANKITRISAQKRVNIIGKILADGLPTFSLDVVGLVGQYFGWVKVKEDNLNFLGECKVISFIELQNGFHVYGTHNQIIICDKQNIVKKVVDVAPLHSLLAHNKEQVFLSGHYNGTVRIWDYNGDLKNIIKDEEGSFGFNSMALLNNGNFITLDFGDQGLIWQGSIDKQVRKFVKALDDDLIKIIQLKNGNFVLGYNDGAIAVADENFDILKPTFPIQTGSAVWSLTQINEEYFVSGHVDGSIKIWCTDGQIAQEIKTDNPIKWLTTLQNGDFASVDDNGVVTIWQTSIMYERRDK